MAAGAGGAGSIFQGAQQETGENSGVGPLPADINMVEPPSSHELSATIACGTNQKFTTKCPPLLSTVRLVYQLCV
ncbi:unnamed protein product [Arctia plantaginis]|uniref:Uncharacterized protein n=1 Tax=Arctia plantaginis TaxID=874455 RepID=A0A8S0YY59_ARCPL|nr:unnamed protein product [Arctia plantaginis]